MQALHPHAVGQLLNKNVPTVSGEKTLGDLAAQLKSKIKNYQTIHYIYVLDEARTLRGVLSITELFAKPASARIEKIMSRKIATVKPTTSRERAVYLALQRGIKEVPIVDEAGKFLGVLTGDDILITLHKEASEDLLHMAGVHHHHGKADDVLSTSIWTLLRHRFPWLFLGLMGGLLSAGIVNSFESTLEKNLVLTGFIPLVVYIAGAVGTQMEVFIIRDLAMDPKLNFWKYLSRQLTVALLIALLSGAMLYLLCSLWYHDNSVALTISAAVFAAILSSVFTGLLVPYALSRLRTDPANASGPLATIVQDILSILIYFEIATLLL
jgi:magnesium transporter